MPIYLFNIVIVIYLWLFHYYFSCSLNFGRIAVRVVTRVSSAISVDPRIIAACPTVSVDCLFFLRFLFLSLTLVSHPTNVRRLRLAPVQEESAIGVAGRSQVFKWLPCSFTSARRPKYGWDSGRRAGSSSRKRMRRHEADYVTKRKTNVSSFSITLPRRRERRKKTRESRRQCFNPSRALLRGGDCGSCKHLIVDIF